MSTIKIPDWIWNAKENMKKADLKPSVLYNNFKKILRETSAEVYICAALGLAVATGISYKIESNREKVIPLGYSEIKQTENNDINPVTSYLASANDIPMKIFECWNKSYEGLAKNSIEAFASELDSIMGSVYSATEFSESLKSMNRQSEAALEELKDFVNIKNKVGYVNSKLDASWNDRHVDNYRTETYLDTEYYTDSDGRTQTQIVTKTRQVYEDTDHYYKYYKPEGEEASRSLETLIQEHPKLKIIKIKKTLEVSPEGKELIKKSRKKGDKLTEEQILEIANKWNTGSTIASNLPTVYEHWNQLKIYADKWKIAKNTAKSVSYTTSSSSDYGPKEFQVAETALSNGKKIFLNTKDFLRGIEYVQQNAPLLEERIRDYNVLVHEKKYDNAKKIRREIMYTAREWYITNFKNGLDIFPFRTYMIVLSALLGLGLGIGTGLGIDKLGENLGLWEEKKRYQSLK